MKNVSGGLLCVAALATVAMPLPAVAAIDVIPKDMKVNAEVTSVKVVNNGNHTEYVGVALSHLLNPGVPLEQERLEPVGDAVDPALYAYPFQISLAPGQTKTIQLKPLRPVEQETVYRLDVKPVVKLLGGVSARPSVAIVANLAFSSIVRQMPSTVRQGKLAVACEASGARLTTAGNVHYRVEGAEVDGRPVDDFNVFPGVPYVLAGEVVSIPGQPVCRAAKRSP